MRIIAALALFAFAFLTGCSKTEESIPVQKGNTLTVKEDKFLIVTFEPDRTPGYASCYGLQGAKLAVVETFPTSGSALCKYSPPTKVPKLYPVHPANTHPCREGVTVSLNARDLTEMGNYEVAE